MKIKVCGMKEPENMGQIAKLGVDLMGLIFYPDSPRFVGGELALGQLPARAREPERVGVFVNASLMEIRSATRYFQLKYVQLHGDESPAFCREVSAFCPVIKAFRVGEDFNFDDTSAYNGCTYFLFDASGPKYGGNGTQFNWDRLQDYQGETPFLLSGGIGPDDVKAVKNFKHPRFAGIDLNSGFERSPGLKAPELLNTFLTAIQ